MNTFDMIILILLALAGICGFRKGLITGLARFIGRILAIGIALIYHSRVQFLLEEILPVRGMIETTLSDLFARILENKISAGQGGSGNPLFGLAAGQLTTVITDYLLLIVAILLLFFVASLVIDIIIGLVIAPLAKNLGLINRGGGFAFAALSSYLVLCLIVGLIAPFLTSAQSGILSIGDSFLYPYMMQGYDLELSLWSGFSDDILTNRLYSLPLPTESSI